MLPQDGLPREHYNLSQSPPLGGVVHVDTAQTMSSAHQGNINELAGVLRRNQACLNCRRRKLKCDAARPNCSTCVRSYKHLLRTAPKSNPVLACEYDDGGPGSQGHQTSEVISIGDEDEDDDDEMDPKKKKRKATGEPKKRRAKKEDATDEETEALRKKIEALEAQLKSRNDPTSAQPAPRWSGTTAFSASASAPSPTAFLEMLSSAASAQASGSEPRTANVPGLRDGAAENAMMGQTWAVTPGVDGQTSTGLTPFLSFSDNQRAQPANEMNPPERQESGSTQTLDESRRSSQGGSMSVDTPAGGPPGLSPSGVFNFSPAPSGPNAQGTSTTWPATWPGPVDPNNIQPSTKTEGPWRNVDTIGSMYPEAAQAQAQNVPVDPSQAFFGGDEAIQQQLLLDLFWPGWQPELPEPHIVNDLVEAFFDLVPNLPRILHRPRFLARLALPPTHSNFPHPALIHAICAASASWCDPAIYQKSKTMQVQLGLNEGEKPDPKATMSFALRQAAYGKDAVQDGLNTGNRLFDVVRAMIILCRVFIDDTRMLECWAYAGLVARMILPLGLNVRSAELSLKSVMLPPPADALEREERRAAVWMAFYHDTIASAASGWGSSMSLEELTVPLPVSTKDFDEGAERMPQNPQDLESGDLWTKHPVVDSFVMCIKASFLMNKVNRFVRKWKNRNLRDDDDLDGLNKPEFRELANAIACFQMSFPVALRNPTKVNNKQKLDIDLIAAHMLPHAATICLYEPFADVCDASDHCARRILSAAQSIVSIVQQLAGSVGDGAQNFSSIMHSSASVCLVTSARTSLLFYRHSLNQRDYAGAESHRMDIEIIRMALGQFGLRFKIGHHHAQLIEYFLDRASNPTYEKLQAHYPEHPRSGAPELHPNANFGVCILNALNVKRGYWRAPGQLASAGVSPFGSTPDSVAGASSAAHGRPGSASGGSGTASRVSAAHIDSNSPHASSPHSAPGSRSASVNVPSSNNTVNLASSEKPFVLNSAQWFVSPDANNVNNIHFPTKSPEQERQGSVGEVQMPTSAAPNGSSAPLGRATSGSDVQPVFENYFNAVNAGAVVDGQRVVFGQKDLAARAFGPNNERVN